MLLLADVGEYNFANADVAMVFPNRVNDSVNVWEHF